MIENNLEVVLTIKKGDELLAVVYNDTKRRAQIFYKVTECGTEEIKALLDSCGVEIAKIN